MIMGGWVQSSLSEVFCLSKGVVWGSGIEIIETMRKMTIWFLLWTRVKNSHRVSVSQIRIIYQDFWSNIVLVFEMWRSQVSQV